MTNENTRKTAEDLAVEIDGAAAMAFALAAPLMENESSVTPETLGAALYSLGQFLERISDDMTELQAKELHRIREAV